MGATSQIQLPGMTVTPSPFAPYELACAVCGQPHEWLVMRQTCCDAMAVCGPCLELARIIADAAAGRLVSPDLPRRSR